MPVPSWMRGLEPLPPPHPPLHGDRDVGVRAVDAGPTGLLDPAADRRRRKTDRPSLAGRLGPPIAGN